MFKTSVAARVVSFAVLIALLFASFPTVAGAAKTGNHGLETKWAKLVDRYYRQAVTHNGAHRWVDLWMSLHRKAPHSDKADLRKDLMTADTAWASATVIVNRHNGFDAQGNVVDKAAAQQSIKDLSRALQRYGGAIRSLKAHIRQFNLDE